MNKKNIATYSQDLDRGRRVTNNRIRGPQSALTDFLASNNISAAQIHADYERRQRQAHQQQEQENAANSEAGNIQEDEQDDGIETAKQKKKRKREREKTLTNIKECKGSTEPKRRRGGSEGEDDHHDLFIDMYTKKKPLPGQLENCELCRKRFTVTPYSRVGPDGGLLCAKCSKEHEAERKKSEKERRKTIGREKRRQVQSNLLDGIVQIGSKSLQEQCIKEVANNIHEVDEFGDLPQSLLSRLSRILSRRRVINSRTLDLFLRPDIEAIDLYDCGKLEVDDYIRIFSIVPRVQRLNLRNAGQFKDEVFDYIMERDIPIRHLQLEAANLVSNEKWNEYFSRCGHRLETLNLAWLDYALDDSACMQLVRHCPNLKRLKLRKCFKVGDAALRAMSELRHLEHLSLRFLLPTSSIILADLIADIGLNLRTLSLENFIDADEQVLARIGSSCAKLTKLRFTENDLCTDVGFRTLFADSVIPPLSFIDLSSNRSIDYAAPDGPEEPIGLASAGFEALMDHSGSSLERLDISSCRHIDYESLSKVFDGEKQYSLLKDINISFVTKIDATVLAAMFRSCPLLIKVTAFGCFNVTDVAVPKGVALIGVPNAQESIHGGDVITNFRLDAPYIPDNGSSKLRIGL
ncbi:MAG: hypothetical protein Q9217_006096 [Psora testacea]